MIIVNVRVPALEKIYNFSLEEKAQISELIEEITQLVVQKEGLSIEEDTKAAFNEMSLCSLDASVQLSRQYSLADYGISDGAELMLV